MNGKRGSFWQDNLGWILIGLGVLILMLIGTFIFKDVLIHYIKQAADIFRFGA
jgi:hypothetical protein